MEEGSTLNGIQSKLISLYGGDEIASKEINANKKFSWPKSTRIFGQFLIGQLEYGFPHILRHTLTDFDHQIYLWPLCRATAVEAVEKTGLLIGVMQIWLLCQSLGGIDLLGQIKGFLDLRLTAGQFYPDAITDINHHYVLNLDRSLTLEIYYSAEF